MNQTFKKFYDWLIRFFEPRYKITVSFNKEYGDTDDKVYTSKKILIQNKYLPIKAAIESRLGLLKSKHL